MRKKLQKLIGCAKTNAKPARVEGGEGMGSAALYCGRGSCLLKVHYTRRMLVKRDDKLIYSVQRSALLSGPKGERESVE